MKHQAVSRQKPGRKKWVPLAYPNANFNDDLGEEYHVWRELARNVNLGMFFETDPETRRIERETRQELLEQAMLILAELSDRQAHICILVATGMSIDEIAAVVGCKRRTVYYELKKAQKFAWEYISTK